MSPKCWYEDEPTYEVPKLTPTQADLLSQMTGKGDAIDTKFLFYSTKRAFKTMPPGLIFVNRKNEGRITKSGREALAAYQAAEKAKADRRKAREFGQRSEDC